MDNTHMDKILNFLKNMDNFYEKNMVKKKTYAPGAPRSPRAPFV